MDKLPTTADFKNEIQDRKERAKAKGFSSIVIISKELHNSLVKGKVKSHVMPSCCNAMYSSQKAGDEIIYSPPKGRGSTLEIRYFL